MRNDWIGTVLLAVLLGSLVYLSARQVVVLERLRVQQYSERPLPKGAFMKQSRTWRYLDGQGQPQEHTYTATQGEHNPNETKAECLTRFEIEVAKAEAAFPPIQ